MLLHYLIYTFRFLQNLLRNKHGALVTRTLNIITDVEVKSIQSLGWVTVFLLLLQINHDRKLYLFLTKEWGEISVFCKNNYK